jgi:hypothetical protein
VTLQDFGGVDIGAALPQYIGGVSRSSSRMFVIDSATSRLLRLPEGETIHPTAQFGSTPRFRTGLDPNEI